MRNEQGRETLDAAIDLVVERMVAGTGEGRSFEPTTLGPRHADPHGWRAPLALAATITMVVAAAALLWPRPPATGELVTSPTLAARPLVVAASPPRPAVRPARLDTGVPDARVRAASASSQIAGTGPFVEMVVDAAGAEGGPPPLTVAELQSAPLELPPLVLGALSVEDIRVQPLVVPSVEMKE